MSKTWCILGSNTLFVFVVDAATMGSVSICCGGCCCWIVVVTLGLLRSVTRQKIH